MANPKTSLLGYLALASVAIRIITAVVSGDYSSLGTLDLTGALAGVGLIAAKDGGR